MSGYNPSHNNISKTATGTGTYNLIGINGRINVSDLIHDNNLEDIPPLDLGPPLAPINEGFAFGGAQISALSMNALVDWRSVEIDLPVNRYIGRPDTENHYTHLRPLTDGKAHVENEHNASVPIKREASEEPDHFHDRAYNRPFYPLIYLEPSEDLVEEKPEMDNLPASQPIKRRHDDDETPVPAVRRPVKRPRINRELSEVSTDSTDSTYSQHSVTEPSSDTERHTDTSEDTQERRAAARENHPALRLLGRGWNVIDSQMGFPPPINEDDEQWQDEAYESASRVLSSVVLGSLGDVEEDMRAALLDKEYGSSEDCFF
ncbi:hypothetical protein ACHAQA_002134 [Verticillium albo-atrum]